MAKSNKPPSIDKPTIEKSSNNLLAFLHDRVNALSSSKIFVAIMMILLNISSKFINIKLSKSMESYFKYSFSRNILIFIIAYMGSRDIYVALFVSFIFFIFMDFLLNENSIFCILPKSFKDYHIDLIENMENQKTTETTKEPSIEEINKAIKVLSQIRYDK
jgi:hypothetical protein